MLSGKEWQLMNTTSVAGSPLLSQSAGGCLGDERRRGGEAEGERTQQGAVTPRTSRALRCEPPSSSMDRSKRELLQRRGAPGTAKELFTVALADVDPCSIRRCSMDLAFRFPSCL